MAAKRFAFSEAVSPRSVTCISRPFSTTCGVMMPMLVTSACVTEANHFRDRAEVQLLSPLTNMTFSCRVAKIFVSFGRHAVLGEVLSLIL